MILFFQFMDDMDGGEEYEETSDGEYVFIKFNIMGLRII